MFKILSTSNLNRHYHCYIKMLMRLWEVWHVEIYAKREM